MTVRPKFIPHGAILAFAGMTMLSARDERLKLAIIVSMFVVVAIAERRR